LAETSARKDRVTSVLPPALSLLRPHQWIKNLFVAAPLFFAPWALTADAVGRVALAVAAFCALSSAVYVLNDAVDRDADRLHPEKRRRPIAAGHVSLALAAVLGAACLLAGAALLAWLGPRVAIIGGAYVLLNVAYSFLLKRIAIVDVATIAVSFVIRVEAGAAAVGQEASPWIVIATFLLALFLALGKRRDDLVQELDGRHRKSIDGYSVPFLDVAIAVTLATLVTVYLIYTTAERTMQHFATDKLHYTAVPVLIGVLRYLQLTIVERRSGAPTDVVLGDRFLQLAILSWIAAFLVLAYR
jgi:4-hydroxybenzoate polyprenyltransferase